MFGCVGVQHGLLFFVEQGLVEFLSQESLENGFGCFGIATGYPKAITYVIFVVDVAFESKLIAISPSNQSELSEFYKSFSAADGEAKYQPVSVSMVENCCWECLLKFGRCVWEIGAGYEVAFVVVRKEIGLVIQKDELFDETLQDVKDGYVAVSLKAKRVADLCEFDFIFVGAFGNEG